MNYILVNSVILLTALSQLSALPIDNIRSSSYNSFDSNPWDLTNPGGNIDPNIGQNTNTFGGNRFGNSGGFSTFGDSGGGNGFGSNSNGNSGNTFGSNSNGFNPNSNTNGFNNPNSNNNGFNNPFDGANGFNSNPSSIPGNSVNTHGNNLPGSLNHGFGNNGNSNGLSSGPNGNSNNFGGNNGNSATPGNNPNLAAIGNNGINPLTGQPFINPATGLPFNNGSGSNALPVVTLSNIAASKTQTASVVSTNSLPTFTMITTPGDPGNAQSTAQSSNLPLILGATIGSILLLGALIVIFMALLHLHKKGQHKLNQTPEHLFGPEGDMQSTIPFDGFRTEEEFQSQSGMIPRDGRPPVFVEEGVAVGAVVAGGALVLATQSTGSHSPDTNHARFSSSETFEELQRRNSMEEQGVLIAPIPVRSKTVSFSGVVHTRRDVYAEDMSNNEMYLTAAAFGQSGMVMNPTHTDYEARESDEEIQGDSLGLVRNKIEAIDAHDAKSESGSSQSLVYVGGLRDSRNSIEALGSNPKYSIVTEIK